MGLFRLDEVLQMAMQAEATGMSLYEVVAKEAKDLKVADLCRQLAEQEKVHYEKFKSMRASLPTDYATRGLTLEEVGFIDSLVQGTVVPLEAETKRIVRENSLSKVLDLAIQTERDSQDFYRQILGGFDASGVGTIIAIIDEENRHEQLLKELRSTIQG